MRDFEIKLNKARLSALWNKVTPRARSREELREREKELKAIISHESLARAWIELQKINNLKETNDRQARLCEFLYLTHQKGYGKKEAGKAVSDRMAANGVACPPRKIDTPRSANDTRYLEAIGAANKLTPRQMLKELEDGATGADGGRYNEFLKIYDEFTPLLKGVTQRGEQRKKRGAPASAVVHKRERALLQWYIKWASFSYGRVPPEALGNPEPEMGGIGDSVPCAAETMYNFNSDQPPEAGNKEGGVAPLYKEKEKEKMYTETKDGQGTSGTVTPSLLATMREVGNMVLNGSDKSVIEEKETPPNSRSVSCKQGCEFTPNSRLEEPDNSRVHEALIQTEFTPSCDPEFTPENPPEFTPSCDENPSEFTPSCDENPSEFTHESPHPDNETPEQKVQRRKKEWRYLWYKFGEEGDPLVAAEIERRSLKGIERRLYGNISPDGINPGHAYNAKIELVEGDGQPQHKNINLYVKELLAEAIANGFTEYVYKGAINLRPYLHPQSPPRMVLNEWHTFITYHRLLDIKRLALATCMLAFREIEYYTRVPTGKQGYFIPIPRPTNTM